MPKIRAERDFWAGVLYIALAAAFLWFGRHYRMGTAARMGSGYFPFVLACLLMGIGGLSVIRAFVMDGPPVEGLAWRKLAIVTGAIVAFAVLLERAGLVVALPALVIIGALGSQQSRLDFRSLLALAALTAFCVLVFVKGLGVPMPIFGAWFDGVAPAALQR